MDKTEILACKRKSLSFGGHPLNRDLNQKNEKVAVLLNIFNVDLTQKSLMTIISRFKFKWKIFIMRMEILV